MYSDLTFETEDMNVALWRINFKAAADTVRELAASLESQLEERIVSVSWYETEDPSLWMIEATAQEKPDLDYLTKVVTASSDLLGICPPEISVEEMPEIDWLEASWRNFPPQQIGRYFVYGSHTQAVPPPEAIGLEVNAATAFGSGEHETTSGCLLTLNDLFMAQKVFTHPLDMGCGSGILAMAMAKTWKVPVIAADNDPESVRVTQQNAVMNQCEDLIKACVSEGFASEAVQQQVPFDLITANILAKPLCLMANDMVASLAEGGLAILSGLLTHQAEEVVSAYKKAGAHLVSQRVINEWVTLLMMKD